LEAAMVSSVRFRRSMPLTVFSCASWVVTSALSIGLSGSWFCICATSSLRKRSCPSTVAEAWVRAPAVSVFWISWMVAMGMRLLADRQRLGEQRLGRVQGLDVVLVGAGGGDHVHHLFHHVDVGHGHVTLVVRHGMAGLVDLLERGGILD